MLKNNIVKLLAIIMIFILPIGIYLYKKEKVANLQQSNSSVPVIIDFYSDMCLECRDFEKIITPLQRKYSGKINIQRVSISESSAESKKLISKYAVKTVPTVVILDKSGKSKDVFREAPAKPVLESEIKELINE